MNFSLQPHESNQIRLKVDLGDPNFQMDNKCPVSDFTSKFPKEMQINYIILICKFFSFLHIKFIHL